MFGNFSWNSRETQGPTSGAHGIFPQRCGGYPEITRFLTVGHAAWGASWNGGDGLRSCCGNVSVDEKNSSLIQGGQPCHCNFTDLIGKDVGLQTVNSNPMLEKIRSGCKNLTGNSAAWDWF